MTQLVRDDVIIQEITVKFLNTSKKRKWERRGYSGGYIHEQLLKFSLAFNVLLHLDPIYDKVIFDNYCSKKDFFWDRLN